MNNSIYFLFLNFLYVFPVTINILAAPAAGQPQQQPLLPSCPSLTAFSFCGSNDILIRFPFWVRSRQRPYRCHGYEGFDLSCGPNSETLITISPKTMPFFVRGIDYSRQEVWVNDPGNCLAARLLSLNFSSSPFRGLYDQAYTFFNCSGYYSSYPGMNPIACLSSGGGGGYSVFATSSARAVDGLKRRQSCRVVATVKVPVELPFYEQVFSSDLSGDLRLTWDSPNCRRCEMSGGRCGLKGGDDDGSFSSRDVGCFDVTQRRGLPGPARYAITIGVGIPLILFSLAALCCICRRVKRCATTPSSSSPAAAAAAYQHNLRQLHLTVAATAPPASISTGLDRKTIESYPKIVLGESRRLPKPDENMCAICLSEYSPNETLKTIPDCGHCFHAECIDEWLGLKGTCPICRNSPEPVISSAAAPVQAWS